MTFLVKSNHEFIPFFFEERPGISPIMQAGLVRLPSD